MLKQTSERMDMDELKKSFIRQRHFVKIFERVKASLALPNIG